MYVCKGNDVVYVMLCTRHSLGHLQNVLEDILMDSSPMRELLYGSLCLGLLFLTSFSVI
jgi:hypothetical protein